MSHETIQWLASLARWTLLLLVVLDPFGLLPLVVGMTAKISGKQRRKMLTKAVLMAFGLLLLFAFGGAAVLNIFGITTDDLGVAGGLLLLVIALNIVIHGHMAGSGGSLDPEAGIVPIISPLLVGPGSITTAVLVVRSGGPLMAVLAVFLAFVLCWLVLRATSLIYKVLGVNGSEVIARIMGVLLAAYAVVYIREGVVNMVKAACKVIGH